jgi:hypothetical protein
LVQAFAILAAAGGTPVIIEAHGNAGSVTHRLALPRAGSGDMAKHLRVALPGIAVESEDESNGQSASNGVFKRAIQLRLSTRLRTLTHDDPLTVNQALLTALSHVGSNENLVLQWVLGAHLPALPVPSNVDVGHEHWASDLLPTLLGQSKSPDGDLRSSVRAKQAVPGWRAGGRIAVWAVSDTRQRQLIGQVLGALRTANAPGVAFRASSAQASLAPNTRAPWRLPLRLNLLEMATISAWPVGETNDLPIAKVGSRMLPPTKAIARAGRVVGEATYPGRERPLAITPRDSLRHLHAIAPSGSGKSTLLLNLIIADMEAERDVVVMEPKGDLIEDVLRHIPNNRIADVVLIDPTDSSRPVGLNPLAAAGRPPELVADQQLHLYHSLYPDNWGPRMNDIWGNALWTLALVPNATLAALPVLLTDAGFRRRIMKYVDEPIGLEPFWMSFEHWSEAERSTAIAPVLNKLRPFLRPQLRAIIGQANPKFDIRDVFTKRRILLVNLAKGQIGPESAALLGSLVMASLWQAALGRTAIPRERRHPVFIYVDEFQDYLKLPTDFADALAMARGLGVGFVLAHQYMQQLDTATRSAVINNVQSRVAWRLPHEDAKLVSAGSDLEPEDFEGLEAFHCYVRLMADDRLQPWVSARTVLPGKPTSDPEVVRAASRQAYGTDREEVEASLRELLFGRDSSAGSDLGRRPRQQGDAS